MRKAKLLSTVAFALLFGAGAASAQGMSKDTPERAPAAQQSAPAEKVAPSMKNGEQKAPQTTGQATPDAKSGKAKETTGQATSDKLDKSYDKAKETTGQSPKSEKSDMGQRGPGGAPQESSPANGGVNNKSNTDNSPAASPSTKSSTGTEPHDHRPRRGWFGKAHDRTAHQDQLSHQSAEGGAGKSERVGQRRNPHPDKRACPSAAAGSHRDLSGVAWLRLHSGGRADRDHQSTDTRDRRNHRGVISIATILQAGGREPSPAACHFGATFENFFLKSVRVPGTPFPCLR